MAKVIIYRALAEEYSFRLARRRAYALADVIKQEAKRKILMGGNIDTGALFDSIDTTERATKHKIKLKVGSYKRYAMVIHQGAKPHLIKPRRKAGMKFYWPAGVGNPPLTTGRVVCFKGVVHHPGIKSNKYLLIPLVVNAPRMGFRVVPLP